MRECNTKLNCKRNLEEIDSFHPVFGRVYICSNCKKYYVCINENIKEVYFDIEFGQWKFIENS